MVPTSGVSLDASDGASFVTKQPAIHNAWVMVCVVTPLRMSATKLRTQERETSEVNLLSHGMVKTFPKLINLNYKKVI
jgi:hypothetical protein